MIIETDRTTSAAAAGGPRLQPGYFEPPRVPEVVARYDAPSSVLGVGSPGKVGVLALRFDVVGQRTELTQHYQKAPLQIMRPIYFDPARPDVPYVYVLSPGGGIVQADRHRTDLTVGPDAAAFLTTQSHTRVYRMDRGYATSMINLSLAPGSYVEYLPEPIVPFAGSRFYQRTTVELSPGSTLVLSDTVYAGRLSRGERHAYDVLATDLEMRRPDGTVLAVDRVRLSPGQSGVDGLGVLAEHDLLVTLYVFTSRVPPDDLIRVLRDALPDDATGSLSGVSALPYDAGVWLRLVSNDPVAVTRDLTRLAAVIHEQLTGHPAPVIRKA